MCGIVGIYFKKKKLNYLLGEYLSVMIDNMSSRGPDSAGFAIYNKSSKNLYKYSLCINNLSFLKVFEVEMKKNFKDVTVNSISDHIILYTLSSPKYVIPYIKKNYNQILIVGYGSIAKKHYSKLIKINSRKYIYFFSRRNLNIKNQLNSIIDIKNLTLKNSTKF